MSRSSPFVVTLPEADRLELSRRVCAFKTAYRDRLRAQIVLAAADGTGIAATAATLGVHVDTVSKWRKRYTQRGIPGLGDAPRSGRPRVFAATVVATVTAMACEPPADHGVPITRWSSAELVTKAVAEDVVEAVSSATVRRWLGQAVIKPWRTRSWISPRDPAFAVKGARVLDLYERCWEGQPLGEDEYVISADEKSQLQALRRAAPAVAVGMGRVARREFEYRRGGTLAYLAGYDVHRAHVIGTTAPTTGIMPFGELVEAVMTAEPYASAARVFWVVDNGSSHNGARSIQRMRAAWPTAQLVHTPVHASWLNQVEVYFSVLQRKVIRCGDFADTGALAAAVLAFQGHYNVTADPFDWRYTTTDLHDYLDRLDVHLREAVPTAA